MFRIFCTSFICYLVDERHFSVRLINEVFLPFFLFLESLKRFTQTSSGNKYTTSNDTTMQISNQRYDIFEFVIKSNLLHTMCRRIQLLDSNQSFAIMAFSARSLIVDKENRKGFRKKRAHI